MVYIVAAEYRRLCAVTFVQNLRTTNLGRFSNSEKERFECFIFNRFYVRDSTSGWTLRHIVVVHRGTCAKLRILNGCAKGASCDFRNSLKSYLCISCTENYTLVGGVGVGMFSIHKQKKPVHFKWSPAFISVHHLRYIYNEYHYIGNS